MSDFAVEAPAPGELLNEYIDPANREVLDEQVQRRHDLIKSRLTWRERFRLQVRYDRLKSRLNAAQYNQLVLRRAETYQTYLMVRAAYARRRDQRLRQRGRRLVQIGRELNAKLRALAPTAAEFADVAQRLKAHHDVIRLEREERENRAAFYREADVWEQQIRAVFRQSPRLHHIQKTERGEVVTIPQIERIICKPDKIYYQIRTTRQGILDRYAGVWHSALPYGVDVRALTCDDTIANLTAACGRVVSVERSKRSQNLFYVIHRLDSADGIPTRILYRQVIDYYPRDRHIRTPWALGVGEDRKIIWADFEDWPHVLVGGASGGGKSNLTNQMVATLITMNSPEEVRLILIDNKGGVELTHFEGAPHIMSLVKTVDDVRPALIQIRQIMEQRFAAFLDVGARNLITYNTRAKSPLPRLVIIIDEMATLLGLDVTTQLHNDLRVISSQGRAVGIHLVISTQHPSVDVLPGWVKTNMTLRIASRMPNHTASQIVVDSVTAATLPDIPGRMVVRRGGFELLLQTPMIDDATIAQMVKLSREYPAPDEGSAFRLPPPEPKFGRDDFIALALEQMDNKISPTRAREILGESVTLHMLRRLKSQIEDEYAATGRIAYQGTDYRIRREKKAYALVPIENDAVNDAGIDPEPEAPEAVDSPFDDNGDTHNENTD